MAFTPEDGTGIAGANSYVQVDFADTYFSERGVSEWGSLSTEQKQINLIKATDYVEGRFSARFRGSPMTTTQGLHFPATGADPFTDSEVPLPLLRGVCEYALRANAGALAPDPAYDESGFQLAVSRTKVGPIEREFKVLGNASEAALFRPYPSADMQIVKVLRPGGLRTYR